MTQLPKKLYVQSQPFDHDGDILIAEENAENLDDGVVGVYELVENKRKITECTLKDA